MTRCAFCDYQNPAHAERCESCGAELPGAGERRAGVEVSGSDAIADQILKLVRSGRKLDAVVLYREQTGAGLKEAKDAVEAIERGESPPAVQPPASDLEREILAVLEGSGKIAAIKLYRERTGVGLAEAKSAVESLGRSHGVTPQSTGCASVILLMAALLARALFA